MIKLLHILYRYATDKIQLIILFDSHEDEKTGKARWEKIGVLLEKDDGKKSIKLDLIPAGNWEGWLTVSERKPKDELFNKETENELRRFNRSMLKPGTALAVKRKLVPGL